MTRFESAESPRRGFLARAGLGAVALLSGNATRALAADRGLAGDPFLGPLTGKHKLYFDAVSVNDGFAMAYAMNWLNTAPGAFKASESEFSAVIGVRHLSAVLGLNDAMWAKYSIGEFSSVTDPRTKAATRRNLFYNSQSGDMRWPGAAIDKLQARGAHFLACGMALGAISGMLSSKAGVGADEAKAEFLANLLPGVVVAPSGVFAVGYAQEKGCGYCFAG